MSICRRIPEWRVITFVWSAGVDVYYSTTGWKLAVDCTSGLPDDKELLLYEQEYRKKV